MTPSRRPFCADTSRQAGEPLGATASRVDHWLLVEYPGRWARDAVAGSLIPAASLVDFLIGRGLGTAKAPWQRRTLVLASVVMNLGILATFNKLTPRPVGEYVARKLGVHRAFTDDVDRDARRATTTG